MPRRRMFRVPRDFYQWQNRPNTVHIPHLPEVSINQIRDGDILPVNREETTVRIQPVSQEVVALEANTISNGSSAEALTDEAIRQAIRILGLQESDEVREGEEIRGTTYRGTAVDESADLSLTNEAVSRIYNDRMSDVLRYSQMLQGRPTAESVLAQKPHIRYNFTARQLNKSLGFKIKDNQVEDTIRSVYGLYARYDAKVPEGELWTMKGKEVQTKLKLQ